MNDNNNDSKISMWAQMVVRDIDNLRSEFLDYKKTNSSKFKELFDYFSKKHEEQEEKIQLNKDIVVKLQIKAGLIGALIAVILSGFVTFGFQILKELFIKIFI